MSYKVREGHIQVPGGRVWYRLVGSGNAIPLLTLHGGPGAPSYYLEPLAALAGERPVVFYDQLGCGRSERPDDPDLWRIDRFVDELVAVRRALGLDRVHILGNSWGSMLAVDYVLTKPDGVASLVLSGPALCVPRWLEDQRAYLKELPAAMQEAVERNEKAGTTDSEDYQAAMMEYYHRHVCRCDPWPPAMEATMAGLGVPVYHRMWGPSEFTCTGTLLDYDRTGRLGEIGLPVLFTCGRYDESRPETAEWYRSLVPGAKLAVLEDCSHETMLEKPDEYNRIVGSFLKEAELSEGGKR